MLLDAKSRSSWNVDPLFKELRHNPILWLLTLVPVALIAAKLVPAAHTLLFVLSVLAIVRLLPCLVLLPNLLRKRPARRGRATQRHARKSDGTSHRSGGAPCRRICAGEGLNSRRYCDKHAFHARSIVFSSITSRSTTALPHVSMRVCSFWPRLRS